jgi:hypothetical protein
MKRITSFLAGGAMLLGLSAGYAVEPLSGGVAPLPLPDDLPKTREEALARFDEQRAWANCVRTASALRRDQTARYWCLDHPEFWHLEANEKATPDFVIKMRALEPGYHDPNRVPPRIPALDKWNALFR